MESIEALKARVALMVESVDLEKDEALSLASEVIMSDTARTDLPKKIRELFILMDRRKLTVQEYRHLLKNDDELQAIVNVYKCHYQANVAV